MKSGRLIQEKDQKSPNHIRESIYEKKCPLPGCPSNQKRTWGKSFPGMITQTEVCRRVGLSVPSINRKLREGTFPLKSRPGLWCEREIDNWIVEQALKKLPTRVHQRMCFNKLKEILTVFGELPTVQAR